MLPYNYILNPKMRDAMGINLANNIVIIDEAHNIVSSCEEAMSFEISTQDLRRIENELDLLTQKLGGGSLKSSKAMVAECLQYTTRVKEKIEGAKFKIENESLENIVAGNDVFIQS